MRMNFSIGGRVHPCTTSVVVEELDSPTVTAMVLVAVCPPLSLTRRHAPSSGWAFSMAFPNVDCVVPSELSSNHSVRPQSWY